MHPPPLMRPLAEGRDRAPSQAPCTRDASSGLESALLSTEKDGRAGTIHCMTVSRPRAIRR